MEVDNLGFHLYREVDGQRTRLTPQLIAGAALSDGLTTSLLAAHSYYWANTPPAGKSVRYFLEDVDLKGKATISGPFAISDAAPPSQQEAERRSLLLSQLNARQAIVANGLASQPLPRVAVTVTNGAASAGAIQLQVDLAAKPAVKITVKQEGVYRLSQTELLKTGLDPKVDPRLLQLYVDGSEQDGHFDVGDAVEFYGLGLDTPATDSHI